MTARRSERDELISAIDAVCADLQALKARIYPARCSTIEAQVESFECYEDYARDILGFTNDLRVTAIVIAASLGNQELSRSEIKDLRLTELADAIFSDARDWCDKALDEQEAA